MFEFYMTPWFPLNIVVYFAREGSWLTTRGLLNPSLVITTWHHAWSVDKFFDRGSFLCCIFFRIVQRIIQSKNSKKDRRIVFFCSVAVAGVGLSAQVLLDPTWTLPTPASSYSLLSFAFASCTELSPQLIRSAPWAWAESPKCLEGDFPLGGPWLMLRLMLWNIRQWLMLWKLENPASSPQVGTILKPDTPQLSSSGVKEPTWDNVWLPSYFSLSHVPYFLTNYP